MPYKIIKLLFLLIAIILIACFVINSADKTNAASNLCVENKTGCKTTGTYYCAVDSNTYCTIQQAVDNASNGDTIWVAPGTYNESVVITNKKLTIKGDLKNESTYFPGKIGWVILDGNKETGKNYGFNTSNSTDSVRPTNIFNFIIRNYNTAGINIINQYQNTYNGKIKNNIIYNNGDYGINIYHSTFTSEIDNNLVAQHSIAGIWIPSIAKLTYFRNNTFYNNGNYGIYVGLPWWPWPPFYVYGGLEWSSFINNIFVNHKINSLYGFYNQTLLPVIQYNDFYNDPLVFTSASKCSSDILSFCNDSTNKTDNPLFALGSLDGSPLKIDGAVESICDQQIPFEKKSLDFQLYLGPLSPAVNAGTTVNDPSNEMNLSEKSTQYLNASYDSCPKDIATIDMGFHYPRLDSSDDTTNKSCLFTSDALNTNLATTTIRFWIQTKAEGDLVWSEWMGPDGADGDGSSGDYGDYFSAPNQSLANLPIKRHIQYRVQLLGNGWYTPVIKQVKINYQR